MNPPPRFSAPSRTVDGRFTDVQSHQAEDESESYMALTKKQIKQLKALAHHLNPIIQVGKNDLSDAAVKQADETIEKRELIKCDVLDGSGLTAKESCCTAPRTATISRRSSSSAAEPPVYDSGWRRRHPYNADGPNRRKRRTLRIRRSYPKLRQLLADGQHLAVGRVALFRGFGPAVRRFGLGILGRQKNRPFTRRNALVDVGAVHVVGDDLRAQRIPQLLHRGMLRHEPW